MKYSYEKIKVHMVFLSEVGIHIVSYFNPFLIGTYDYGYQKTFNFVTCSCYEGTQEFSCTNYVYMFLDHSSIVSIKMAFSTKSPWEESGLAKYFFSVRIRRNIIEKENCA